MIIRVSLGKTGGFLLDSIKYFFSCSVSSNADNGSMLHCGYSPSGVGEYRRKGEIILKRIIFGLIAAVAVSLCLLSVPAEAAETGITVGGIHILKTDVTGNPLNGAVFRLVREVKDEELTDHSIEKKILKIGDENRLMTVMSFWNNREMTGQRQREVETDRNGNAAIYGLPYGTYYLVEEKAPEGYNRITAPIRVAIHRYSHLTESDGVRDDEDQIIDNTLHIINVRYTLPDTGNLGRIQLAAAGCGILFSSVSLLLLNRRRWK